MTLTSNQPVVACVDSPSTSTPDVNVCRRSAQKDPYFSPDRKGPVLRAGRGMRNKRGGGEGQGPGRSRTTSRGHNPGALCSPHRRRGDTGFQAAVVLGVPSPASVGNEDLDDLAPARPTLLSQK